MCASRLTKSIAAVWFAVLLVLLSSAVSAQSLSVRVTAAESGSALRGVFVSILDASGAVVRSGLTGDDGRFVFALSQRGSLRVKAELIGRTTQLSDPVVARDQENLTISLALGVHALSLSEIRVEADERCRLRRDEAAGVARVWEEVRKALAVQAWSERQGLYRLTIATYDRDLDRTGRVVERESRAETSRVTRVPFASLPAEELLRGGFVRGLDAGGYEYYGPDAALLLSDVFLDTHCFRLKRSSDQPGAIGLAFEPVRATELADIRGTLWVEENTGALRFIEYQYTRAPYAEAEGLAAGRVELEALPDGTWIIDRWWIRAPLLVRHQNLARAADSGIRVSGIRETGGMVTGVATLDRRTITQTARGSVHGQVWDSVAGAPLAGATVFLSGTQHRVATDSVGRFRLAGVDVGVFTAGFTHPRLDSLGTTATSVQAEVTAGGTTEIVLATPSYGTILLDACRAKHESGAMLYGRVTDRMRGDPVPGARVRAEWQEVKRVEPVLDATDHWVEVVADSDGRYSACGIPIERTVRIRASLLRFDGPLVEVTLSDPALKQLDLGIELPADASVTALAPIVVAGNRRLAHLDREGFYRRRDEGIGKFFPPEVFETRLPSRVTDLLFGVPGTYVAESSMGNRGRAVYFRSGIGFHPEDICFPMIYVDRRLVSAGGKAGAEPGALDEVVQPTVVAAMEIYRSRAEVPADFLGTNARCGVIVIWTRRGAGN